MGGADPRYVDRLAVDGWSLEKIVGVVEPMSAETAGSLDSGWVSLANESQQTIADFVTGRLGKLGNSWVSAAGDLAAQLLDKSYSACAQDSANVCNGVASTLSAMFPTRLP